MTNLKSRRAVLKSVGAAGLAVGLAGCSGDGNGESDDENNSSDGDDGGDGSVESQAFTAELSDDDSIPGHESANSDGSGEATLERRDDGTLEFEVGWDGLEGEVNGIHIHGEGAADGGYMVRLFEPEGSEHADSAIVVGEKMAPDNKEIDDVIDDDHVNPSGDYDGEIETVDELVAELETAELGESGGVINIHTEHAPDSELAGLVEPQ